MTVTEQILVLPVEVCTKKNYIPFPVCRYYLFYLGRRMCVGTRVRIAGAVYNFADVCTHGERIGALKEPHTTPKMSSSTVVAVVVVGGLLLLTAACHTYIHPSPLFLLVLLFVVMSIARVARCSLASSSSLLCVSVGLVTVFRCQHVRLFRSSFLRGGRRTVRPTSIPAVGSFPHSRTFQPCPVPHRHVN